MNQTVGAATQTQRIFDLHQSHGPDDEPAATMLAHAACMDLVRIALPAGGSLDAPVAGEECLVICIAGRIDVCMAERTCELRAGQVLIAPAGELCELTGRDDAIVLYVLPAATRTPDEIVQEASEDSFPASDAPAWTGVTAS